jgi:hypothetical protein
LQHQRGCLSLRQPPLLLMAVLQLQLLLLHLAAAPAQHEYNTLNSG